MLILTAHCPVFGIYPLLWRSEPLYFWNCWISRATWRSNVSFLSVFLWMFSHHFSTALFWWYWCYLWCGQAIQQVCRLIPLLGWIILQDCDIHPMESLMVLTGQRLWRCHIAEQVNALLSLNKKAQLTQKGTCGSGACLKVHYEENL